MRDVLRCCTLLLLVVSPSTAQTPPDWSVNASAFQSSLSITGLVQIDGIATGNPDDLVAAFVGEEVRGVTAPTLVAGQQIFFLTVFANTNGEALTFKTYDATTGRVLDLQETLLFTANAILGSPSAPFDWTTTRIGGVCSLGDPSWSINPAAFESSMSVTGAFFVVGNRLSNPNDRLAAFVGDEIRGLATPFDVNGQAVYFLSVFANTTGEKVQFFAYDAAANQVWGIEETFVFEENAVHGLPSAPVTWTATCAEPVALAPRPELPQTLTLHAAFPNPFQAQTTVQYTIEQTAPVQLLAFDALGQEVAILVDEVQTPGTYKRVWQAGSLAAGVYFLRLVQSGRQQSQTVLRIR